MFQTNAVNGGMGGGGGGQAQQHGPSAHYSTGPSQQGGTSNGAPPSNGAGGSMAQLIYPALHLQPLNDTFAPKQICLAPPGLQNKVKIGRQTNNKTLPQPSNGYFDSKVLSRMHAEVWSQDGKVYIKDVKSSNGTFINGARLSPEGQESDTFELHTDDVVEFGIDIVSEDNKSIIHHKVACRVFLVMTAEEALGLRHDFAALYRGGIAGSTLNHHAIGPGAEGGLRRSKMTGNGTGGYAGGVGGGGVAGPNGMMSFDHILHRLQAELQKSKDTAGELGSLNAAMSDIGETLGGGLPPMQHPPYQHLVPSSSAANSANEAAAAAAAARDEEQRQQHANESSARAAELRALEEQVRETQKTLQAHIDRLAAFEARVEDNESIKGDLLVLREQVNRARFEEKEARSSLASRQTAAPNAHLRDEDDVDDNASVFSVDTVVPHEGASSFGSGSLEVDEVDSLDKIDLPMHSKDRGEDSLHEASLLHRLKDHVGPLAPPDGVSSAPDRGTVNARSAEADTDNTARNDDLSRRLEAMENQLERALEIGRTLADQHAEATDNVRKLEDRIKSLETEQQRQLARSLEPSAADETAAAPVIEDSDALSSVKKEDGDDVPTAGLAALAIGGEAAAAGGVLSMLESKWGKWRETFETEFAKERAGISADREDLRRVVRMWDTLNQEVEDLVEGAHTDDGGANGDESPHVKSASAVTTTYAATNSSKKKKKRKGGNASNNATVVATPVGVRRSPGAVGLGASAELNRHLRALIYTDDYNLLVRETHMESDSSTSASSSVSDTSRSVTSKTTDDTSVGSVSGGSTGGGGTGTTNLDDLPDGVRKRAMGNLASSSGRRKPARTGGRWPEFGSGTGGGAGGGRGGDAMGHGFDHPTSLPVLGAAGVAVVAMTAWIMAGRGMNLAGGPGG